MSKLAVLTKPRFSFLHLITFGVALAISTAIFENWADFKEGIREGYNSAASRS